MLRSIQYKNKSYIIKKITRSEMAAIEKLNISKQYQRCLDLMINGNFKVNQFTGNIETLNNLVRRIKEIVKQ